MADTRLFALDITGTSVGGALFTETKQGPEVLAAHFCQVSASVPLEAALAEVIETCGGQQCRCLLSCGADQFHYRTLHIPFTDRKKVRSVVPFEIEDSASFQDEPFLFDYLLQPPTDVGTGVFAVLVEKQRIEKLLSMLNEQGLDPELITVSGLPALFNICRHQHGDRVSFALIQIDWARATVFIVIDNEIKAIRSLPYSQEYELESAVPLQDAGTSDGSISEQQQSALKQLAVDIKHTLLAVQSSLPDNKSIVLVLDGVVGSLPQTREILLGVLTNTQWDEDWSRGINVENYDRITENFPRGSLDNTIALACCSSRERERINFRKDEFIFAGKLGRYSRLFKVAAAVAVLVIAGITAYQAVDYSGKKQQRADFQEKIESLYSETVAGATPGPDPVKQLQIKVNELRDASATGTVHDPSINAVKLMADISVRLPKSMEVSFERFIYDRKSIRIRGVTDNFNTVDLMKKSLGESPHFSDVTIGSANVAQKEKGVRFELKLQL